MYRRAQAQPALGRVLLLWKSETPSVLVAPTITQGHWSSHLHPAESAGARAALPACSRHWGAGMIFYNKVPALVEVTIPWNVPE